VKAERTSVRKAPVRTYPADPTDPELLARLARHLEGGGLLAYPTETVYGLGAVVTAEGVEAVRALKGREPDKPFIVLLPEGSPEALLGLEIPGYARALADVFWPGPLTLVLHDAAGRYPEGVRSEQGGVAVRMSPDPFVRALLGVFRRPLLSTSANVAGEPPALDADDLRDLQGRPGFDRLWIVDGGRRDSSVPSTVVDATGPHPSIVRAGRIFEGDIAKVVAIYRSERAP
jgi:L-threonylcarbamoyladenylate synthase